MRDIFAAVARPAPVEKVPEKPTDFRSRWAELADVVRERWGQAKAYQLEMHLSFLHKLIEASGNASNAAWSAALEDLRAAPECPGNIPAWMAAAIERAKRDEAHAPTTSVAHEGDVTNRKTRAYKRIAGHARPGEP